jgi:uncharacterized protein YutE (UPF0331/DUF86 family)
MDETKSKSFWKVYLPLYSVALAAVVIIIARIINKDITFDNISLILFAIAAISILLPYLLRGLPPLKKVKIGDYEVEFDQKLRSLESKIIESEQEIQETEIQTKSASVNWQEYFREYSSIIKSPISNVEKILAAANLVERMIIDAAKAYDIIEDNARKNTQAIIAEMEKQGLISRAERDAFSEFSGLRNQVVHGGILSPTDSQTARFLDLGWRLVRTFA